MSDLYVHRALEPAITTAIEQFPVVVVTGARQTGKSTLLRHLCPTNRYITFDDPLIRESCRQDPALFLENYPPPLLLDEIQYVPEILPYIKMAVDQNRRTGGQYILTGSQMFPLMRGVTESLAGRAALFELFGLTLNEYPITSKDISGLFDRIFVGGYPDPLIHRVDRRTFYASYLQTYLERDIRMIQSIQDISQFQSFLELLAGRAGQLLNLSSLARDLGVSQPTAKRWLTLLENSRIVYLLRPYHRNMSKRVVKSPKLYFLDTGLLSFLLKYPDRETLLAGPAAGALLENYAVAELFKTVMHCGIAAELYFYRDLNGNEVDLIIEQGHRQLLAEIKLSKSLRPRHYEQLERSGLPFANPQRFLISAYGDAVQLTRQVHNLPAWEAHRVLD